MGWGRLAGFMLAVAIAHVMNWAHHPPGVDPINFHVALDVYDVGIDAPHPPGYPLFVGLGRIASSFVGARSAYALVNLILLLGAACSLMLGSEALGHRTVGVAAAVLLLTHPLAWSATIVAESYVSDAAFATAVLLLATQVARGRAWPFLGFASLFFLFGLFRVVTCLFLAPLAILGTVALRGGRRWELGAWVAAGSGLGTAGAFFTTVACAGGYEMYRESAERVMGHAVRSSSVFAGASVSAHGAMFIKLVVWAGFLAVPFILALTFVLLSRLSQTRANARTFVWTILALAWWLPPFAFYAAIYYLKPTYQLVYLPLFVLGYAACVHALLLPTRPRLAWSLTVALVLVQLGFFHMGSASLPRPLYRLTGTFFADQDAAWDRLGERLAALDDGRRFLVWDDHPRLPVHVLRLMDWSGPVLVESKYGWLHLQPATMTWSQPSFDRSGFFRGAVVVASAGTEAAVDVYDDVELRESHLDELSERCCK